MFSNAAQVLDVCEHYVCTPEGETARQVALVFAKDMQGKLHRVIIHGLEHELCVAVSNSFQAEEAQTLAADLNDHLLQRRGKCRVQGSPRCMCPSQVAKKEYDNGWSKGCLEACLQRRLTDQRAVLSADLVMRRGFTGYEPEERPFLKFKFTRSYYASYGAAQYLTDHFKHDGLAPRYKGIYQMPTKFSESFINQTKIAGFDWVDVATGKKLEGVPDTQTVPLRTMVFDIECLSPAGFPDAFAGHQIGMITAEHLPLNEIHCYVLGDVPCDLSASERYADPDDPVRLAVESGQLKVHYFATELELLKAFVHTSIQEFDPDFITGYNSNNFDIPYVLDRLQCLGAPGDGPAFDWTRLGRDVPVSYSRSFETSAQKGTRPKTTIHCPGRTILDVYRVVSEDTSLKLEDASLNGVATYFKLGTKGDVEPNQIYPYFHGTAATRGKLLYYNIVDVILTRQILNVRMMVQGAIVSARLYRVLPNEALSRGISYTLARCVTARIYDQYLHPTLLKDYQTNTKELNPAILGVEAELKLRETSIVGGYVPDPEVGYYQRFLAVLDFNSLYPSIIRAYNLCHTTWVRSEEEARRLGLDLSTDVWITPNNAIFVKSHIRKGVLPAILEDLVNRRNFTRKQQSAVEKTDRALWNTLESLQLAFKVAGNAVYGNLSAKDSLLCLMLMGEAVTTYGQFLNKSVFKYVAEAEDLRKYNIRVVYGDTDSSMLLFDTPDGDGPEDVEAARRAAVEIANSVNGKSGIMVPPLKVGIDSLNVRSMFLKKKGYATVSISSTLGDPIKSKLKIKGLQFIKRDYCLFMRETGEEFLNRLMVQMKSKEECFNYLRDQLAELIRGQVPADKLVLTKKLSKALDDYGEGATELHVAAGRQLQAAGEYISPGDRIHYLMCEPLSTDKSRLLMERVVAEKLWRAAEPGQQRRIDFMYYAESLASSFDMIGPQVFGEANHKALFNLNVYTAKAARFVGMFSADGNGGLPRYVEDPSAATGVVKKTTGTIRRMSAAAAAAADPNQVSFMDSFLKRSRPAVKGRPAGVPLDDDV